MNGDVRISAEFPLQICSAEFSQQLCQREAENQQPNIINNQQHHNIINNQHQNINQQPRNIHQQPSNFNQHPNIMNQQLSTPIHNQVRYDPGYMLTPGHPHHVGSDQQHKTAAAFFAKKKKCGNLPQSPGHLPYSPRKEPPSPHDGYTTSYASVLGQCPPVTPSGLLKKILEPREAQGLGKGPRDTQGLGKVRVYLKVHDHQESDQEQGRGDFFKFDKKKKQVTLLGPDKGDELGNSENKDGGLSDKKATDVLAPRMFAFDGLFTDDPQLEVSTSCLSECIQSVLTGTDATLFSFGHSNLGKSQTMLGTDESTRTVGVIPTAIAWTFRCLKEMKDKTGMKLSIRVSALEISGAREELRDLLLPLRQQEGQGAPQSAGPGHQSLTEVCAPSCAQAGQLLDYALARRVGQTQGTSHLMLSLHVYHHSSNSQHYLGKSRLNLIDFGYCERNLTRGGSITQAGLGHVILGILNGQRHLPFKESRVTSLLRDCLGPVRSLVGMLAHVSSSPPHYSETLHTVQIASRIHRIRRKKKTAGSSGGSGSGSSDENRRRGRVNKIPGQPGHSSSDMTTSTDPSSSEQSCDTVIYLGPRDDDGTDAESPPVYLPTLNSADNRGVMSRVLRGSSAELPPAKYRSLDRAGPGGSSPRYSSISSPSPPSSLLSTPLPPATPVRSGSRNTMMSPSGRRCGSLPRNPRGKMPLYGKVAGYKQPSVASPDHGRPAATGFKQPATASPDHAGFKHTNYSAKSDNSGVPNKEIWVDSVPFCDKDVITVQYNDNQSLYGYMDEHKKQMIQQWVEGQTMVHNTGPPSHLTGIESLVWLEAQSQRQKEFKVLTQFKMAESSTSSTSDKDNKEVSLGEQLNQITHHQSIHAPGVKPEEVSERLEAAPGLEETGLEGSPPQHRRSRSFSDVQTMPPFILTGHTPESSGRPQPFAQTGRVAEGGREYPSERSGCPPERMGTVPEGTECSSQGSRGSRKSDRGTSTEDKTVGEERTLYPSHGRDQDPYRAQRKLPLRRESMMEGGVDGGKTLDQLFMHCEQLVETLSQASEELKAQCHTSDSRDCLQSLTIHDPEDDDIPDYIDGHVHHDMDGASIADVEVYEVSEGSEGSIEVVDRSCQVSEDDIIAEISRLTGAQPQRTILDDPDQAPPSHSQHPGSVSGRSEHQGSVSGRSEHPGSAGCRLDDILEMQGVCEDVGGSNHEEFFSERFDQLAKLHQLYQSVSSINAKCQSRLESRGGDLDRRVSSLTALGVDNASSQGSVSDDLNSLCSEPAWLSASPFVDINKNSTLSLNILDLCNLSGGINSLSLTSLTPPKEEDNISRENSIMDLNIETMAIEERCDSPILEGIDSELAKYAKLRDLQQAYNPRARDVCDITARLSSLRHPDGASNPDLTIKPETNLASPHPPQTSNLNSKPQGEGGGETARMELNQSIEKVSPLGIGSLSERSPGTGRSSSGSDAEETLHGRRMSANNDVRLLNRNNVTQNTAAFNGHNCLPAKDSQKHSTPSKRTSHLQTPSRPPVDIKLAPKEEKPKDKPRIPRFSRLFGSTRKISRSPSQPNKCNEDKLRSKQSKHKHKTVQQQPSDSERKNNTLTSCKQSKANTCKESKNVKGTLSSEPSCERKRSKSLFRGLRKPKNQGVNLVRLPATADHSRVNRSEFSEPTRSSHQSSPSRVDMRGSAPAAGELSGYDSGIDVTPRIRGKGANIQISRKLSRAHCRSSGYESIGLEESERDSLDSCQGTLPPLSQSKEPYGQTRTTNPSPLPILDYDKSFVKRLDSLWRFHEIKRLKKRQEKLKVELSSAKGRINVDPKRWSYDLHTESSGLDHNDPTFVEAFTRETEILGKRVAACQAHVLLTTCFDHPVPDTMVSCTTECVPAWAYTEELGSPSEL